MEVPTRSAPRLTTTPLGRLIAVKQLAALRKVAAWNRQGVKPTRYVVAMGIWKGVGARGYPYIALRKLLDYGLLRDVADDKYRGSALVVTDVGKAEIAYWDANPILAQEGRR